MKVSETYSAWDLAEAARSGYGRIHVCHVITSLTTGGAEVMLYKILSAMDRERFVNEVVCLGKFGRIGGRIENLGIRVRYMDLPVPSLSLGNVCGAIRACRADIVQGWMYHGNLFATLAGIGKKTAWNIRANLSDKTIREDKRLTRAIIRLGGYLSFLPAAILYNSYESLESHGKYGYSRSRAEVIPNGFDTEVFRPNPAAKARLRSEWGIPKGCAVVGLVGRYHPIKDHPNFLEAARVLSAQGARARYVLAGTRIDHENHELAALLKEKGLEKHVVLLGERSDMHEVTAAFDIAVSSSRSEAFANVVGEAMACGVPCIVTDVGDSRRIIGETGLAVPPSDPDSLAGALKHMISQGKEREEAGKKARARVCREFSLAAVASKYESLYARMLAF